MSDRDVIDLDRESGSPSVILKFRGIKVRLDRARVLALLEVEQRYLDILSPDSGTVPLRRAPPPSASAPTPAASTDLRLGTVARRIDGEEITHAKLSTRIKKVYDYAVPSRQIRPAHSGLLLEMIEQFDWAIPAHPNTHLDQHLEEMLDWDGVTSEFKTQVSAFLAEYRARRAVSSKTPA